MQPLPLESIRQAVNSGEFGRAQLLWAECSAALAVDLSAGCLTAARLSEVRELVEWSRMVALCERAHLQRRLNTLHAAREYEMPVPARPHRLVSATF
jgi:predicted protein tyrosine phosphatase